MGWRVEGVPAPEPARSPSRVAPPRGAPACGARRCAARARNAPALARTAVTRGAARETEEAASEKRKKTHRPKKKKEICERAAPIDRRTATVHPSVRWYAECIGFDAFDLDAPVPSKWYISMVRLAVASDAVPPRGGGRGCEAEGEGGCHSARARAAGGRAGGRWAGRAPSSRAVTTREEGVGGAQGRRARRGRIRACSKFRTGVASATCARESRSRARPRVGVRAGGGDGRGMRRRRQC